MNGSNLLVIGSNLKVAGAQYGPMPALLPAATLTVYITPSVRLASTNVGDMASIVTLVSIREKLCAVSMPRTMT